MSSNPKAEKFEKLGDKCMNKFSLFGAFKQTNMENAAEHYIKAAAQYKISKDFEKSGECYEKAAKANMSAGNEIEAIQNWKDSGKMYRHVDSKKSINAYKNAIQYYLESNKFSQAAKLQEEIAEMLLEDDKIEEAIQAYEECADLFKTENEINQMNKRLLKVAHMSAKIRKYPRAIQIFEQVANHNVDNNLLRWNVKTLLWKCMICQLNNSCLEHDKNEETDEEMKHFESCNEAFDTYKDLSDIFASSREAKCMEILVVAVPQIDMDKFKQGIIEYDRISKLDPWCTEQLLHVEHWIDKHQRGGVIDLLKTGNENNINNEINNNEINNNNKINNNNNKKETNEKNNPKNPFDLDVNDTTNGPDLTGGPNLRGDNDDLL